MHHVLRAMDGFHGDGGAGPAARPVSRVPAGA